MGAFVRTDIAAIAARIVDDPPPSLGEIAVLETGIEDEHDALETFLDSAQAQDVRQLRAALIVQVLARNPDLLEERGIAHRKRVLAFVDSSLSRNYRRWGVDDGGQDFQRIDKLKALAGQANSEIRTALEQMVSLDTVDVSRNGLQRAFNTYRPVLAPLVPGPLLRAKVGELLEAARDLRSYQGSEFLAAHSRVAELLAEFGKEVHDAGPVALMALGGLVERLGDLVGEAYETNPATEPAELVVKPSKKKYPLGSPNGELRFGFHVTNAGLGQALDARFEDLDADGVELTASVVPLGQMMPGTVAASLPARTTNDEGVALIAGNLRWQDSDGRERSQPFEALFESQRADIAWEDLRQRYDLDPVSNTHDLVGRTEMLRNLSDLVGERRVGSAFITGQKRVGKTSIALTFQDSLASQADVVVVYLEAGTFVQPSGARTIEVMGQCIAEELAGSADCFNDIASPIFEHTLAPLKKLVGQMRTRNPKLSVVIVIDEFDELPLEVYRRGPVGDAFFLGLRALASQEHIGFLLVGGEKMAPIIDAQGDQLNKFETIPVTYLDRERHWDDFADLVRVPVQDCFEITDGAILVLFECTAGHPYFTKLICRALFRLAVRNRDAHLTEVEVRAAIDEALAGASTTNFIHFWEDGVLEIGEMVEEISVRRRKLLLAYAECSEAGNRRTSDIIERAELYAIPNDQARELIREFGRRGVLVERGDEIHTKVELFDMWLRRYGVGAIATTFSDPDSILHAKRREREQRVDPEEITDLVGRWGVFRGRPVTSDEVRSWLNQFESVHQQRLMFGVLQAVRFYDATLIRAKLREAHGIVRRGLRHRMEAGKLKRDEIVVSYLGGVGKSGARYARLYADENGIYAGCVTEASELLAAISAESAQALVLVDDMLGSGDQAREFLTRLDAQVGAVIRRRNLKLVLVVLAGFDEAQMRVEQLAHDLELPLDVHVCDPLGDSARCFSEQSTAFEDEAAREEARGIAESYGRRLQRKSPLGYKDVQATIVFDESCPNGTLPILWDVKNGWRALFPRHKGG